VVSPPFAERVTAILCFGPADMEEECPQPHRKSGSEPGVEEEQSRSRQGEPNPQQET
jgi:hypothetical protein